VDGEAPPEPVKDFIHQISQRNRHENTSELHIFNRQNRRLLFLSRLRFEFDTVIPLVLS
jgi:hypothetical protein